MALLVRPASRRWCWGPVLEQHKSGYNVDMLMVCIVVQGRMLLWGWLQERRKVGSYDYAGCLSVPRVMHIRGERLIQEPIPEVSRLRSGQACHHMHLELEEGTSTALGGVAGPALDIVCSLERCGNPLIRS